MDDRQIYKSCPQPVLPQNIVVRQVVGENEQQKTIDIHVVIPRRKPAIEQIVDVFVKKLKITDVEVITDKVIVRGDFELKAIYVACLPDQPVHAVEARRIRYTAGIDIRGARRWMDGDASAVVEFVDYDNDVRLVYEEEESNEDENDERGKDGRKPAWKHDPDWEEDDDSHDYQHHESGKPGYDGCDDEEEYHHKPCKPNHDPCDDDNAHDHCKKKCKPCWDPCKCTRHFAATVILRVTAKVMCDRPIALNPTYPGLPYSPKG